MVTAILKDGKNEISHLEKSVTMASSGASVKGSSRLLWFSPVTLLPACVSWEKDQTSFWCGLWPGGLRESHTGDHSKARESMTQIFPSKSMPELSFSSPNHIQKFCFCPSFFKLFFLQSLLLLGDDRKISIFNGKKRQKMELRVWGNF